MIKPTDSSLIKSQFNSFEEYQQYILGWGLEFEQLDYGRFQSDTSQIMTPDIIITETRFNRRLVVQGNPPPGMRTFALLAADASPFVWRKHEMTKENFAIFPKGGELHATNLEGFHVYTLSLAEHLVEEKLHQEESHALAIKLQQGGVLKVIASKLNGLRSYVTYVFSMVNQCPQLMAQPQFQQRLRDELANHIFDILALGKESSLTRSFQKHVQIVKNIEDYVADTDPELFSVAELSSTFHINERTLRRIFIEWYGVSPQQYLLAIRLNGVRKELIKPHSQTTLINDVASRFGFWHMGRFASYYKRQFSELPSETLSRG